MPITSKLYILKSSGLKYYEQNSKTETDKCHETLYLYNIQPDIRLQHIIVDFVDEVDELNSFEMAIALIITTDLPSFA